MKTLPLSSLPPLLALVGIAACGSGPPPVSQAAPAPAAAPAAPAPAATGEPGGEGAADEHAPPTSGAASSTSASAPPGPSSAAATPPPAGSSAAAETRTTAVLQKVVQENRKPIRACYEAARKETPNLRGALVVRFVLDPEGKLKSAELVQDKSDIRLPKVVDCVLAELGKLPFPPSSRGMDTTVVYPFDFKP